MTSRQFSKTESHTVLGLIQQYAPRRYETHPYSEKARYVMSCPFHESKAGHSFSVHSNNQVWMCFTGCGPREGGGGVNDLLRMFNVQDFDWQPVPPPTNPQGKKRHSSGHTDEAEAPRLQGGTRKQLAEYMRLPESFLEGMQWVDSTRRRKDAGGWYEVPTVRIPHPEEGRLTLYQHRVGLDQGDRFCWESFPKGQHTRPLGLWNLDFIYEQGEVFHVEGATDFGVTFYNNLPCLGWPGARNVNEEYVRRLDIVRNYVWKEPGSSGENFVSAFSKLLPDFWVIGAPPEAKDPRDLYKNLGPEGFRQRMGELKSEAQPFRQRMEELEAESLPYQRPEEQRRALVKARMAALYGIRGTCANWLRGLASVELGTLHAGYLSRQYRKLLDSLPILLANPLSAPDPEDLVSLREKVEQDLQHAENLEKCGWVMGAMCAEHGERFRTNHSCRLPDHAACPTKTTEKLRVLTLPDAPRGGNYRSVWLNVLFPLPLNSPAAGQEAVKAVTKRTSAAVGALSRRRAGKGLLLSRSTAHLMAQPMSCARLKLLFLEQRKGDADLAIQQLCEKLNAKVFADKRLTADQAILQLIENTMSHLEYLQTVSQDLYASWLFGVKGLDLHQSYGILFGKLDEEWTKGEIVIPPGEIEVVVPHKLGTQVVVKACPKGIGESVVTWQRSGQLTGFSQDPINWGVIQPYGQPAVLRVGEPVLAAIEFRWRAKQDTTPRCDLCGVELEFSIIGPPG